MDVRNSIHEHIFLILVICFGCIALIKCIIQLELGPGWDTYSFSLNALAFSGNGTGYYEYDRGPFVPFLASLVYRMGYIDINVMMVLDAIFVAIGAVMLYFLVSYKTSKVVAMLTSFVYLTSIIVLDWTGVGYTDLASITLSICALYMWVTGLDEAPWRIPFAWVFFMLAFLTRTTAALILVPMVFYYVATQPKIKYVIHNLVGFACAFLAALPVMVYYQINVDDPLLYFKYVTSGLGKSVSSTGVTGEIYSKSKYYFVDNIGSALLYDGLSVLAFAMVVISIAVLAIAYIRYSKKRVMSFWILILLTCVMYLSFEYLSFIFVEGLLFIIMLMFFRYTSPSMEKNKGAFFLMFVLWGLSYFFFHSSYYQKVTRYYITMMPAIALLFAMGSCMILRLIGTTFSKQRAARLGCIVFIMMLFGLSGMFYLNSYSGDAESSVITDSRSMATWIDENIDDFDESLVYSDYWVPLGWYTRNDILSMPFYFDSDYFEHELQKYHVDYYATNKGISFTHYEEVYRAGGLRLIGKVSREQKPEGLYIGRSWENYAESILDFSVYLFNGTTHVQQASEYVDDYTREDLNKYDFIALYNFKWRNFNDMQSLLESYVAQGGTLVIDCSHNFSDPVYSLDNEHLLGMMIRRRAVSAGDMVQVSPDIGTYDFSQFVYGTSEWYGATYASLGDNSSTIIEYATIGDTMLAAQQNRGSGEVLWMGYNLMFHAFEYQNPSEAAFIQEMFDRVLTR